MSILFCCETETSYTVSENCSRFLWIGSIIIDFIIISRRLNKSFLHPQLICVGNQLFFKTFFPERHLTFVCVSYKSYILYINQRAKKNYLPRMQFLFAQKQNKKNKTNSLLKNPILQSDHCAKIT